jgi:hypothetical protein
MTGNEEVARQIGRLYDPQTGRVRDPAHARAAEAKIRGPNAPPLHATAPEAPPAGASTMPALPPALPASAGGVLPGTVQAPGK